MMDQPKGLQVELLRCSRPVRQWILDQAAELVRLREDNERLRVEMSDLQRAYVIAFDGTYQGHSSHWDAKGTHGLNCPECRAAADARRRADDVYDHFKAREPAQAAGGE